MFPLRHICGPRPVVGAFAGAGGSASSRRLCFLNQPRVSGAGRPFLMSLPENTPGRPKKEGIFVKTEWSAIRHTPGAKAAQWERAREEICRHYWAPIFLILCKRGYPSDQARDITQGFLLHFLKTNAAAAADPAKGRFRHFLVGALDHYLADLRDRERAQRRGGGALHLSLDDPTAIEPGALVCENSSTQFELVSDREWALGLVLRAFQLLETKYVESGRGELFRLLKSSLLPERDVPRPYASLAAQLGRTEATVRSDAKRLREQFRAQLREVLCQLVGPARLDEEWENLRQILHRK